jgi:hypothetical protein
MCTLIYEACLRPQTHAQTRDRRVDMIGKIIHSYNLIRKIFRSSVKCVSARFPSKLSTDARFITGFMRVCFTFANIRESLTTRIHKYREYMSLFTSVTLRFDLILFCYSVCGYPAREITDSGFVSDGVAN